MADRAEEPADRLHATARVGPDDDGQFDRLPSTATGCEVRTRRPVADRFIVYEGVKP